MNAGPGGFSWIDVTLVCAYLAGVTFGGLRLAGASRSSRDYFLGGKHLRWWLVGFSIVASETSTLTFISVPGLAYTGNLHFLQLAFGYVVGRYLVSVLFLPAYFRGDLETVYDFLGRRFGLPLRRLTSAVFLVTRVVGSAVRLFATAIPVHLITGLGYPECILLLGSLTLFYTWLGGLKAVVALDVVQLGIYLAGAGGAFILILHRLPHGWADVVAAATAPGVDKLSLLSWPRVGFLDFLAAPYTLLGGVLGGTFITLASHGTDQLLVQRLLGCPTLRDSQKALMLDAVLILLQFAFFLLLGLALFAFYGGLPFARLGLTTPDGVFPKFIVEELPRGLRGLVVAGVLASAMGTLSSAINALASSTFLDLVRPTAWGAALAPEAELRWSKAITLGWGGLLILLALGLTDTRSPVVELGLKVAGFTYGGLLGVFLLGLFHPAAGLPDALVGMGVGLATAALLLAWSRIDFTWHTLLACGAVVLAGVASARLRRGRFNRIFAAIP